MCLIKINQHSLHFDCQLLTINCSEKPADQKIFIKNICEQHQVYTGKNIYEQVQLNIRTKP